MKIDGQEEPQDHLEKIEYIRRRTYLPWWIKTFCWIFMMFGVLAPIGFIAGLFGATFNLAIYGLETMHPISVVGLIICSIFFLKGITAFSLWTEKEWAINVALIDAWSGIIICVFMMFAYPYVFDQHSANFKFRLELALIIPYLIKLYKIKPKWVLES